MWYNNSVASFAHTYPTAWWLVLLAAVAQGNVRSPATFCGQNNVFCYVYKLVGIEDRLVV